MKIPFTKSEIDLKSLKYKKTKFVDDSFGVYLITGKQGSNKTYKAVDLGDKQDKTKLNYIKTNIHSLNIPNIKHEYFTKINEIYYDTDEYVIYIIDEISRKYPKNAPVDTQFYAWLNQSRKRKRIVILITQEYLELPMWIRRPCKYMLTNMSVRLPYVSSLFGIYKCVVGDGYDLIYDKDEGVYTCPTIKNIYYKRNRRISSYYDTFEPINDL